MKYLPALILAAFGTSCIEPEQARPYDEFVAEYRALRDGGLPDPTPDVSGDTDMGAEPDIPPAPDLPAPTTCSVNGAAINVQFLNDTGREGQIHWVDYGCTRVPYSVIAPGARVDQGTFVGHVWQLIATDDPEVLSEVVLDGSTTLVVFE